MAACYYHIVWTICGTLCSILITAARAEIRNTLSYTVIENTPRDTLIADLVSDSGLKDEYPDDISSMLNLTFVDDISETSTLFRVKDGRKLVTAQVVDRDESCPSKKDCVVQLDLQVEPFEYFQIIKVSVQINDTNDNSPTFREDSISRVVSESASPGSTIPIPTAKDADSPQYGIKRYSLVDPSGTFDLKMTENSGEIQDIYLSVKGKLDREARDNYEIEIRAFDSDNKMGALKVTIQVQDVNDNPPVFTNQNYEFSVPENVQQSTEVGRILAHDADTGINGMVLYGLSEDTTTSIFHINSTTGAITVVGELDREIQESYSLTVTAKNDDVNSLPTLAKVDITILDVNDNAPSARIRGAQDDKTVTISESAGPGTFVAHITVNDLDKGRNGSFNCSIFPIEHFELSRMFDTEFKLSTKQSLDRETQAVHNMEITCVDFGVPVQRSTKEVIIQVQDVNDNTPRFRQSGYSTSLLENNDVGVFLERVQAVDPDEGTNGLVRYYFENTSNSENLLRLDPVSGNITANASFDHETIAGHRIEVRVVASDQGEEPKWSVVTVIIDVIDLDDETPTFDWPEYVFSVPENENVRTEVGLVKATDKDSDLFNKFKYQLDYSNEDADAFTVHSQTGQIYTSEILNREAKAEYQFPVKAVSFGLRPKSSTTLITVHVTDVNDNDPEIIFPNSLNHTVHISNRIPKLTIVTTVQAMDKDNSENARLSFSIRSGNDLGYFRADDHTGAIVLEKDMSKIDNQLFGMVVAVQDNGSPPRASEAFLNIIVNKSLAETDSGLMSNQNLTIVITIATISGLVMVFLLVAIVAILRYPKLTKCISDKKQKYNQNARIIDRQQALNESFRTSKSGSDCNGSLNQVIHNDLGLSSAAGRAADLSFVNLSFQDEGKESEHHQTQTRPQQMAGHTTGQQQPSQGQGQGHRSDAHSTSLPPRDYPPSYIPPPKVSMSTAHSDTDSGCSADMSNVTDIGKGSHDSHEDLGLHIGLVATPTAKHTVQPLRQDSHTPVQQNNHQHHNHNHHHHHHHHNQQQQRQQHQVQPPPPTYNRSPAKQNPPSLPSKAPRSSHGWRNPQQQQSMNSKEGVHGNRQQHHGNNQKQGSLKIEGVSSISNEVHV